MSVTKFPLGVMAGGPNGSNLSAQASFEAQFNSFVQLMGASPQFMDGFIDNAQPITSWASNASWTAWSWRQSSVAGSVTPVIGLPMATSGDVGNQDAVFKQFASGQYDTVLRGIVDAWAAQGYTTLYFRPGYEMNGTFMPWYAGDDAGTRADWLAAFQHIADVLHGDTNATVKIVWSPNVTNWNTFDVTTLYPGDSYVDVVGPDLYSPMYPRDLYDWNKNDGTYDSSFAQWAADPVNRAHYWSNPAANRWHPADDGQGYNLSLQDTIDLAKAHNKPFALSETGAGGDGGHGPSDDPAFPQWLASTLSAAGVPIAFVNIWDVDAGDGDWSFSGYGTGRPLEAAAWAKYFGAVSNSSSNVQIPVTIGSGADSLVLAVSQDAWQGDAQFTVSVDGKQVGGTQTATASHGAGQAQAFTLLGNFGGGTHTVAVNFLNDAWGGTAAADRNLYVDSIGYAGATTKLDAAFLSSGTQSFSVVGAAPAPVTIGSGADSLVLAVSEDAWQGNAQFTVSVDGKQVGGTQTAMASHGAGQTQAFTVLGSFGGGTHTVAVNFLNDAWGGTAAADRNLYVGSISYAGATTKLDAALLSSGTQSFSVVGAVSAPVTIGSGADSLVLTVSEDAWQGDAQFTISVDGKQVGGTQTATASHAAGAIQSFTVNGNWGTGRHTVGISFINDAYGGTSATDRNLYVSGLSYDGQPAMPASAALMSAGTANFTVPPAGPGTVTLLLAEDAYAGDAQFSVAIDGTQIVRAGTVTAANAKGQTQAVNLAGTLTAGVHDVAVSFLNDAYGGTADADRNLYVKGVDVNGSLSPGAGASLYGNGTQHFSIVVPS